MANLKGVLGIATRPEHAGVVSFGAFTVFVRASMWKIEIKAFGFAILGLRVQAAKGERH